MKLCDILAYTDGLLEPARYHDYAPNGLQVAGDGRDIRKIVFGVTACLELIEKAQASGADALFVHHGWFWKHDDPRIIGIRRARIATILNAGLALVGYHLPLDDHPDFGNNAMLGKALGLTPQGRFGEDGLGWIGTIEPQISPLALGEKIEVALGRPPLIVGPMQRRIACVAWCTGAAQDYLEAAALAGADAFISGEISERTTHIAREAGIPYFACGHHATEKAGIRALSEIVAAKFPIETEFIDVDNPV